MKTIPDKIVIASANMGKVNEIRDLVRGLPVVFLSLNDVAGPVEIVEDAATFEENALKKAKAVAKATGITAIADDSGLCIDALDGRPGVYSARYAGENATDEEKCLRILKEMADVTDDRRSARFICALAMVTRQGEEDLFGGVCEGKITRELRGSSGFGYDPIFYFEQAGSTFAEMDRESKNRVSHRGQALRKFASFLEGLAHGRE